jgi:hypothetical protein
MKSTLHKCNQGSALVVTLLTCFIIGIAAASYLALISSRYNLAIRSTKWNSAMPVLEAGIEEALAHLNADSNPAANGWTAGSMGGQPIHTKERTFADGSYFKSTIYNALSPAPTIYSTGYVPGPLGKGYISRTVRVTAIKANAYPAAIAANGLVTLSGSATIDSYNSCLGPYSPTNSMGTNGSVATNFGANPAIKVGTGHIYGTVNTGPGGVVSIAGGSVGDKDWNATHSGVQPGWGDDTMNVAFSTNGPPPGPLTPYVPISGTNFLGAGSYKVNSSFTSSSSTKPLIVTGKATLYVVGSVTVSGSGFILIQPGASLKLYVGANTTISGGGVVNGTGNPASFTLYGLPTVSTLTYSGSAAFIGTINAPQSDFTLSGSGGAFGAAIVKSYLSSGGSSFHYDECLGIGGDLIVASWREM